MNSSNLPASLIINGVSYVRARESTEFITLRDIAALLKLNLAHVRDRVRPGVLNTPKRVRKLTFRMEETDIDVSLMLIALRYQFEAIEVALDTENNPSKGSYLALGGATIVQDLIERLDDDEDED